MPPRPTRSRPLSVLALTLALLGTGAGLDSAYAAQPAPAEAPPAGAGPAAPPAASTLAAPGTPAPRTYPEGDGLETARTSRPLAPGASLSSYDRLESDKWLRVHEVSADLGASVRAQYLSSAKGVSAREPVSALAAGQDPGKGRRTVAAFNGDFFDINETGAPEGSGLHAGSLLNSPQPSHTHAIGFDAAQAGRVLDLYFDGTLTLPSGDRPLAALNAADVPGDGIGAYTAAWGEADRALTVNSAADSAEVTVVKGRTTDTAHRPGKGRLPAGATVLVGAGKGAEALRALPEGAPVSWSYHPRTGDGSAPPREAIGANEYLVTDGRPVDHTGEGNDTAAPRTAVGFSRDGRRLHVVTVDGRQADSGGVTLTELGLMLKKAGAYNAVNLDGGGSSTLLTRTPGTDTLHVGNQPSDGAERPVPNGLVLTAPDGSGRLTGYWVSTAMDPLGAPTADPVAGGHPDRVFPGLHRRLTAEGHDETYGPAKGTPVWTVRGGGTVDRDGRYTAPRARGTAEITARRGGAKGTTKLTVLGPLDRIETGTRRLSLPDATASARFGVTGLDAAGRSAPVEPSDVRLTYDPELFTITADADGFTVTARAEGAAGTVTATVAGHSTALAVSAGLTDQALTGFDDAGDWTFSQARAAGSLAAVADSHDGTGLRMTYDFTRSTATRAAYATPPAALPVPGQPQAFTLWLKGDGHGAWATLHLKDATGTDQLLRGPYLDWTGWKKVTFPVPQSVAYPVSVARFYLAETDATKQYEGEVELDGLTAQVPPAVDLPESARPHDPLITTARDVRGKDWRFAVMSDAQFVARDPEGENAVQARRTLREIRAAKPDFLVIDGDLVDEGSPEDLAFAHRMLDEELGDAVPWHYVPGNHEVMGGSIGNFTEEFGAAEQTFDHKGTRFLTLDTSRLGLRVSGFPQVARLRAALDAAAKDRTVDSVVVVAHVPPRDPTPQKGSQLGDRKEAALVESWLADFRRTSGKGVAYVAGHVGTFDASHAEGVPYLVNGNSGKNPATPADEGGFTGWSLLGVDRAARPGAALPEGWLGVQTRPHTDTLRLAAPARLAPGTDAAVTARLTQGTRAVPLGWPVSADWSASRGLHLGPARTAGPRDTAAYDPATGRLTALRPGTVTLAVTVSGVRAEARVTVKR
ncbi:phosphodiester glycosidase family protein [Streptomyces sp. NRRL F-5630]|uniref:phosphodiester glycosidase family protein n=1 Tax=Streptomyces sp. NRRL F-5630 TaxID=1463864 RepID=UPI003D71D70C